MAIKLAIEIVSPLTQDDHELLSGIAVMTLAIANRELAAQRFPETFPPEELDGLGDDDTDDPSGSTRRSARPTQRCDA